MSLPPQPTEINYMISPQINSNSQFHYKDITSYNYANRIKLDPENEHTMDIRNYIPLNELFNESVKEFPHQDRNFTEDAFTAADYQSEITKQISLHKYQKLLEKEEYLASIIKEHLKQKKDIFIQEKMELKKELVGIIRDALNFSKKNSAMTAMLPTELGEIIAKIKDDRNKNNMSISSINLSRISKNSTASVKKYESNAFLKALGLDLINLNEHNINIDIDKAYEYIQTWKVNRSMKDAIRYKVVNEIMSVEEKRSSQKAAKIYAKIAEYKKKKKEEEMRKKRLIEEAKQKELENIPPREKIKMKMKRTLSMKKDFTSEGLKKQMKEKEAKKIADAKEKLRGKTGKGRRRRVDTEQEKKPPMKLNGYKHVDKILTFIKKSDNLILNQPIYNHFLNIKETKKLDDISNKCFKKNKLILHAS